MAASNDGPTKGTPNEAVQQHQSAEMPAQPDGDVMDVDPDKALEAQQIKEDLDQLHELYIKVRRLRSLLPRLLKPVSVVQYNSPQELYEAIQKSRVDAQTELDEFQQLWQSEASTRALDRGRESRNQNPTGIKPWKETDHPDWYAAKK